MNTKITVFTYAFKCVMLTMISSFLFFGLSDSVMADTTSAELDATVYEFDNKSHYDSDKATLSDSTDSLGCLSLSGDFSLDGDTDDITSYLVSDGNIDISYTFDNASLETEDTKWHLSNYKSKKVGDITLSKNILSGALILQTSTDGENWITEEIENSTDIFSDDSELASPFYSTVDIQLQNGCYYRVIIVYRMTRKTEDSNFLFINTDKYETKEVAEVYEFYASFEEEGASAEDTPRTTLGTKVNAGKDTGYSEENTIDKDDPHYGWDIGSFFINGYTRTATDSDSGETVFLKNVGDKVTLWFTLEQDISCLNNDENLVVSDDTNGYDQYFEIEKSDFGKGTLIIRYTDDEGVKHDPVIYTNFLEAVTRTGADTRVQLFEEGDYEVALDYEISDSSGIITSITNYRISFSFSIRNGNCMVYPFDISTGSELADHALTENGFMLDMANSKYLNIDVAYSVLTMGADNQLIEDVRFNRPAKDGSKYTDEGIYTFTVSNQYTGSTTTKTIYVGTDSYLSVLSNYEYTVEELNAELAQGATVSDDGEIITATEPTEISSETASETETEEPDSTTSDTLTENNSSDVSDTADDTEIQLDTDSSDSSTPIFPIIIAVICVIFIIVFVCVVFILKKKTA